MKKTNHMELVQFRNKLKIGIQKSILKLGDHPIKYLKREYEQGSFDEKRIIWEKLAYTAERCSLRAAAIRINKTILKFNKTTSSAWCDIIRLFLERKKYKKALEVCKEASNVFPNELWFLKKQITIIQHFLKKDEEIVEICRKVLNAHPEDVYFWEVLAKFYDRIGSPEDSHFFYQQILKLDSTNRTAREWINLYLHNKEKENVINQCKEELEDFFNGTAKKLSVKKEATKKSRHIPMSVRREVWRRDEGRCVECGSQELLSFHHIILFSMGGSNTARNIQILCEECHRKKGCHDY